MVREEISRVLSAALIPLGIILLILGVDRGEMVFTSLGAMTVILGVALYWAINQFSDASFDLTESPTLIENLIQLGSVFIVFSLLITLVSDVERVTQIFRTGLPSPKYPAFGGLFLGVVLGGGVPYLMQQFDAFAKLMSDSVPVRILGLSLTFGTYLLLLIYQPASSLLYAAAYLLSRISILVGMYSLSRPESGH